MNEEIFYLKQNYIVEIENLREDNRLLRETLKQNAKRKKINSNRTRSTGEKQ